MLGVPDITDVQPGSAFSDVKYSPANTALATKWHIIQSQGLRPIWYVSTIKHRLKYLIIREKIHQIIYKSLIFIIDGKDYLQNEHNF